MKNLLRSYRRSPSYFIGYFILFVLFSIFCFSIPKADGFLLINKFHTTFLDYFFVLFTNIGNGIFVIGITLFMLMRKKTGWACQTVISFLISGLIVQLFKHLMPSPRPKLFFGSDISIHCIHGITGTGSSSFPSGHSASVFAFTTLLCLYFSDKKSPFKLGLFFLLMAFLTGFSRIYLSQHFPVDVLAGSLIGVLVSLSVFITLPVTLFEKKLSKDEWETQSVKLQ